MNIFKEIETAKLEYLDKMPSLLDELGLILSDIDGKKKSEIDISKVSSLVRQLHNIKSVAGSYGIDFLVSACRNILDHTTYINELDSGEVISTHLGVEIISLMKDYIKSYKNVENEGLKVKLASLLSDQNKNKRVLVVEKDRVLVEHLRKLLIDKGMSFSFVDNGVEAFNRIVEEKFDLLITDFHVGKLDGPSLIASSRVITNYNEQMKTVLLNIGNFDLLPSLSVPDFFVSKNEHILEQLGEILDKFKESESGLDDKDGKISILGLDDDENIHDLLKISFSSKNIEYQSVLDGRSFVSRYKENKPDLIILDLVLENESGADVIRKLKEIDIGFNTPVIVLSSLQGNLKSDLVRDIPHIIGTLSKPFTPKLMAKEVVKIFVQYKKTRGVSF